MEELLVDCPSHSMVEPTVFPEFLVLRQGSLSPRLLEMALVDMNYQGVSLVKSPEIVVLSGSHIESPEALTQIIDRLAGDQGKQTCASLLN
jgi:hypothetical protein